MCRRRLGVAPACFDVSAQFPGDSIVHGGSVRFGQAEVTDTKPMGIPFHLRERSVEGALLSPWLDCVDVDLVFACLCFWPG